MVSQSIKINCCNRIFPCVFYLHVWDLSDQLFSRTFNLHHRTCQKFYDRLLNSTLFQFLRICSVIITSVSSEEWRVIIHTCWISVGIKQILIPFHFELILNIWNTLNIEWATDLVAFLWKKNCSNFNCLLKVLISQKKICDSKAPNIMWRNKFRKRNIGLYT